MAGSRSPVLPYPSTIPKKGYAGKGPFYSRGIRQYADSGTGVKALTRVVISKGPPPSDGAQNVTESASASV